MYNTCKPIDSKGVTSREYEITDNLDTRKEGPK